MNPRNQNPEWNNRVLIVDDQENIHDDFDDMLFSGPSSETSTDDLAEAFLEESDDTFLPELKLFHASSGEQAYTMVKSAKDSSEPVAVAYVDIRMPPGIDGIETIRRIRKIDKNIEIVIMTAYTDKPLPEIVRDMELLHKLLYIRKPFAREEVQQITMSLVQKWNIEQELKKNRRQLATNHRRLETVIDASGDAIGMFDDNGNLLFANHGYRQLFDLTKGQLDEISPADLEARIAARLQAFEAPDEDRIIQLENVESIMEEIDGKDNSTQRLFYRTAMPIKNTGSDGGGTVVSYRDISKEAEIQRMKAEVVRLRTALETTYSYDEIEGKSKAMRELYSLIQRATEGNITVLIQGESGTGKELVARSIHYNSQRKAGPFVTINCTAIPESLIESELFGHERGAFTGASARRIGKFEQADKGTIFLDEIGEMQLSLQAKLLRVLQERHFQRVGGATNIVTDIRVLTATNRDLEAAVNAGGFREDLYFRIAAFPIRIPPLRERLEDIPALANHFLKKYVEDSGKSIRAISPEALQLLVQYDFPGNVRELENVIERAVLFETTEFLQPDSLSLQIPSVRSAEAIDLLASGSNVIVPLDAVERRAIINALKVMGNNVTKAAEALGIDRSTFHRKLNKYSQHDADA
ncbi:MAG: sigma 54-interacting transcriptional regulator [Candidatus Poribacteria bacterium]|nr:sigma 54-interacting transcriptional regulator [Candidatus Poribacteria bacterium]